MIQSTLSFGAKPIYDSKRFATKFTRVLHGIGAEVAKELTPIVQETFKMPAGVAYPIQWTTPKQRKYFFYAIRAGIIPGYKFDEKGRIIGSPPREGKVAKAWRVVWIAKPDISAGTIRMSNTKKYAKYVYGGFNIRTQSQQQRFHRRSGWASAGDERDAIMDKADELMRTKYNEALGSFGPLLQGRIE